MVGTMRRAARKDGNHNAIVRTLRQMGATVIETHQIGGGFPDLLVQRGKTFQPAEVKLPGEDLNDMQVEWWKDHGLEPRILRTLEDCERFMGARQAARPVRNS